MKTKDIPRSKKGLFMKNKYGMFTIRECTRENTCYTCDDPDCRKAGDIEADCQLYDCVFSISKCHSCEYNRNNEVY